MNCASARSRLCEWCSKALGTEVWLGVLGITLLTGLLLPMVLREKSTLEPVLEVKNVWTYLETSASFSSPSLMPL